MRSPSSLVRPPFPHPHGRRAIADGACQGNGSIGLARHWSLAYGRARNGKPRVVVGRGGTGVNALVLPIMVFCAEMCVITLNTLRTIFIARGMKFPAAILGLLEVSTWLFAISQIMQNLTNVWCFLAYVGGFMVGNLLGVMIEEKIALGTLVIRMITKKDASDLITLLQAANYGVTSVRAEGTQGPVHLIFTVIQRRQLGHIAELIEQFDPKTFYSVEDVRSANEGVFPRVPAARPAGLLGPLWALRGTQRRIEQTR